MTKYLKFLKPDDLFARVKASGQNFLSLGFCTNGVGISVVDTSLGRSFIVPMLESSEGNFTLSPLETEIKSNMIKEITSKVLSLRDGLTKLMTTVGSSSLKEMMVGDLVQYGELSPKLGALVKEFTRNQLVLRNLARRRDSSTPRGEFENGIFVLHHLLPVQVIKPGMSVEGVRNILNKLIALHNVGGLLISFDMRYFKNQKKCKFLEEELRRLDKDGQLLERSFSLVEDVRALKKVERDISDLYPELSGADPLLVKYPSVGQVYNDMKLLRIDLTKYKTAVRDSYATMYLSDSFYQVVAKQKLKRNKLNRAKQLKMLKYAQRHGYYTEPGLAKTSD